MGAAHSVSSYVGSRLWSSPRKRQRTTSNGSGRDSDEEDLRESHRQLGRRRKRLMTTSQYIYKALFQEGQSSDVTLVALGREWNLHKIYLRQSAYFASMFSGVWKESSENIIHIEILDPNINLDSLRVVLGSLYQDELEVEADQVVSILATASLFQLDPVITKCGEIMSETINAKTVLLYYEASKTYGIKLAEDACFKWLLINLLSHLPEMPDRLRDISEELMGALVSSQDLCVIQTEFSLYVLLKLWLYLKLHPAWEGTATDGINAAQQYFRTLAADTSEEFLSTEAGKPYAIAFRGLRLPSLLGHPQDVDMLIGDRIISAKFLDPVFRMQWYNMLRADQGIDKGPYQLSEQQFNLNSRRCGRLICNDGPHTWRWTGFHFGLDLVLTYDHGSLRLRRNHRMENEMALSQQTRRNIMYRISVYSLDQQRQMKSSESTGIQSATLNRNEEIRLMTVEDLAYPLLLSANFLVVTP